MNNYEKQNFVSGQILKAEHLNHMEDGIGQLSEEIADLSWDDLKGKPFGSEHVVIEWDGNTEGHAIVTKGPVTLIHVSDAVLTAEQCIGASIKVMGDDGTTDILVSDNDITYELDVMFVMVNSMPVICVAPSDNYGSESKGVVLPKAGVYFTMIDTIQRTMSFSKELITPIPEKYLPSGGSGGSSLTLTKYVDADYFTSYSVNKPYDELLSMVKEGAITTMSARSVLAIGSIDFHTMHCICIDTVDGEDRVSMLYRDVDGNAYWVNMKPDNTIEEGRPSSESSV